MHHKSKNLVSRHVASLAIRLACVKHFIHSFHCHVQNVTIPCRSQELLPFLSVMYFFLPPFSNNYSSIFSQLILPSIFCLLLNPAVPKFIYNTLLRILFSSILCTCPNQHNLFKLLAQELIFFNFSTPCK